MRLVIGNGAAKAIDDGLISLLKSFARSWSANGPSS